MQQGNTKRLPTSNIQHPASSLSSLLFFFWLNRKLPICQEDQLVFPMKAAAMHLRLSDMQYLTHSQVKQCLPAWKLMLYIIKYLYYHSTFGMLTLYLKLLPCLSLSFTPLCILFGFFKPSYISSPSPPLLLTNSRVSLISFGFVAWGSFEPDPLI